MESTKLTLRPPADIVQAAHLLAKEENTSITQLFTSFIMSRRMEKQKKDAFIPTSPMLAELLELIPPFLLPDDRQELLQTLGGEKT